MKKIILFIIVFMLLGSIAKANEAVICFEYADGVSGDAILAGYDEEGKLIGTDVGKITVEENVCYMSLSKEISSNFDKIRVYFPKTHTLLKDITILENNDGDEDKSEDVEFKPPYPEKIHAVTAFMVVKSADSTVINDEVKTKLILLYQGREIELVLDEGEMIDSAPLMRNNLVGEPVSALKEGDVIYCATNMSGKIRSIELIYRPLAIDIIRSETNFGNNFELLYSDGASVTDKNPIPISVYGAKNTLDMQYAFGLIKYREDGFITLTNKSGTKNDEIDIRISPDTVVYVYDISNRKQKVSIGSIYDIEKSEIYYMDKLGNVSLWPNDEIHHYALVRMADGNALDIITYKSYNY